MILAVVDLGSNSFKMTVAQWVPELRSGRPFRVLHKERHAVQLGRSVFADGRMSPKARKAALRALDRMNVRLKDFGVPVLRVVATSAIREAADGRDFVEEVRDRIGLPIEIITGTEEARLIARGLEREYSRVKRGLLVDIGGGSTEVASFGPGWKPGFRHSLRLGSVRVATRYFGGRKPVNAETIRRSIRSKLAKVRPPKNFERLVGSAGTLQSLGEIFGAASGPVALRRDRLDAWIEENLDAKPSLLERRWGLAPSRARVVVPGALVLSEILRWLKRDAIVVTSMTLRDGLLVDLVAKWRDEEKALRRVSVEKARGALERSFGEALLGYLDRTAGRFGLDRVRAAHTGRLAVRLFDELRRAGFRFGANERLYLFVVAYLYRCGEIVSKESPIRHSAYILKHLEIPGFAERERELFALIALGQRKEGLSARALASAAIKGRAALEAQRVCALLRLALALDPQGRGAVEDVAVRRSGKRVSLDLRGTRGELSDAASFAEAARAFETLEDVRVSPFFRPSPKS